MGRLTINAHDLFRFVSEDVHANMYILLHSEFRLGDAALWSDYVEPVGI